ncbi:MAG: CBS domain-containing protein, partial [Alphaproteobacteria bacterium]
DEVMIREVITCQRDDTVNHLMTVMTERRIRHLPVVEDGLLVGIISIGDVVKRRIEETEFEAEALRQYIATG